MSAVTIGGDGSLGLNFTPHPIILTDRLREELVWVFGKVAQRGAGTGDPGPGPQKLEAAHVAARELFAASTFHQVDVEDFVRALCELSVGGITDVTPSLLNRLYSAANGKNRLPVTHLNSVRQQAKYALYSLWAQGKLLLPITFSIHRSLSRPELHEITTEIALFCLTFPETASEGSTAFRMVQHVPRWLVCTGWRTPEDVSVDEALAMNRFLLDCGKGTVGFPAPSFAPSVRLFLVECLKAFPHRVRYTVDHLKLFDLAFGMRLGSDVRLSGVDAAVAAKLETSRIRKRLANRERARQKQPPAREAVPELLEDELLLSDGDHLIYETKYERLGWFGDVSRLSFLTKHLSDEAVKLWSNLFQRYLDYRTGVRELEATDPVRNALRVLADYLRICIPVSYNQAGVDGPIPSCPREFTRFPFIDDLGQGEGNTPTFLAYVTRRFVNESAYSHVNHVRLFFEYIEANYRDEAASSIAGPSFKNPIVQAFDLPRVRGRNARKTNKKPFGKTVIPHLLHWVYAVERFGMHLQDTNVRALPRHGTVNARDFGFVPEYGHMGTKHEVLEIPVRLIRPISGHDRPSLTVLRMITACLEIGLRMQALQWLCRKNFDRRNVGEEQREFFMLTVNTDKTNDGFSMPILPRVRELLLREQADQEAYKLDDVEIFYENRPHTRFEKLVPLFRNVNTNAPYVDNTYATSWNTIMEAFHAYYQPIGRQPFVSLVRPQTDALKHTAEGHEFCPLKVEPLYTPHSCRSTFITRRSPFIVLDDIAKLVGHASGIVSSHYDYPEHEELAEKLIYADQVMSGEAGPPAPVTSGPAFIKAKEKNSALRISFDKDREGTIFRFGMIALQPGLDVKADGAGALELLRASPMSQVVFRETHICPVGEHCPAEVIAETGSDRRCGICPLACKCVDHLPAIAAKQRQLLERVKASREAYARLSQMDDQASELGEIHDASEADFQEYLGWRLAEEILEDIRKNGSAGFDQIHVARPEIVRQHLTRVVKRSSHQEFVLRRIIESNTYPTFATDYLRLQAVKMTKRLMAGVIDAGDLLAVDDREDDEIVGFARLVSTILKANDYSLEQLAEAIARPLPDRRTSQLLLTAED